MAEPFCRNGQAGVMTFHRGCAPACTTTSRAPAGTADAHRPFDAAGSSTVLEAASRVIWVAVEESSAGRLVAGAAVG